MKVANIGSLNVDDVFEVEHLVKPGETLAARSFARYCGGKGLNQSVALARAGAVVAHCGCVGKDGVWLVEMLRENGVGTDGVRVLEEESTGLAVIQVDRLGENCILLYGGANRLIAREDLEGVWSRLSEGDWVLLQNETNVVREAVVEAARRGFRVALNPAPMTQDLLELPRECLALLILNETEAEGFTGASDVEMVLGELAERFPSTELVLTLGGKGAVAKVPGGDWVRQSAYRVDVVDTTAAGDTFLGYYLSARMRALGVKEALELGCKAAAMAVMKKGAAPSIPMLAEVEAWSKA